jgi:adenylate cyclase
MPVVKIPFQKIQTARFVLLTGILTFGAFLLLAWFFHDILWEWEQKTVDYRFRLRGPITIHPAIVHIDIDDESLKTLGLWPLKRSVHAELIRRLDESGVKSEAFDIVFSGERDPASDAALVSAVQRADKVYLPIGFELRPFSGLGLIGREPPSETGDALQNFRFSFDRILGTPKPFYTQRVLEPMPALIRAAKGIGHISATPDSDGVFRRVPLVVSHRGRLIPSLALATAIDYLDIAPSDIEIEFGRAITLKNAHLPGRTDRTSIAIPINTRGEMVINFAGKWDETFPHYSAVRILNGRPEEREALKTELNQKLSLISLTASGLTDTGPGPLETSFPLNGVHSNILNTILTQQFLYEPHPATQILTLVVLAVLLLAVSPYLRPAAYVLVSFLLMLGYTLTSYVLFKEKGFLLNLVSPWLSVGLVAASVILARYRLEEKERGRLRSAFELYLSPQVLEQALEGPDGLTVGGRRKKLTVLFSDVVGFSSLSDRLEPEETQALLNDYFEEMTRIVFKHEGTIDKFIGDGLMVLWGDPLPCEDHALRAVSCAVEMQKRMKELQPGWEHRAKSRFEIRIGVNTGWMTVGNMGSKQRMSYTVVGREVNLAQRLEASAEPGTVLMGERTYGLVQGRIAAEDAGMITVKGFNQPIRVYKLKI